MGMSSSQARLLTLTARMHQIEYKAARLEAQKLQMANESNRVYEEYLNALDAAKIQHKVLTNDASITYKDINFNDLCYGYTNEKYGLFSTASNAVFINESIAEVYEMFPSSAEGFATYLTGYLPDILPTAEEPEIPYETPVTDIQEDNTNISLVRTDSSSNGAAETITAGSTINLNLSNLIGTVSNYNYTITTLDSSQDANINVQLLDNGRLVISGNNLNITADSGQKDDIILLGSNNKLSTADGDDIVRIAQCRDSSGVFSGLSTNNIINTGSGKDHVTVYNSGNTIQDNDGLNILYSEKNIADATNTSSAIINSSLNATDNLGINNQSLNTIEGCSAQVNSSDCRLLSLINSLGKNTNNGNLSNYVSITSTGSGYNVKFKNYNGSGVNNINITQNELENYKGVTGDLTTVLIDYAINKLMYMNKDDERLASSKTNSINAFSRADYQTVSMYMFGNTNFADYSSDWGEDVKTNLINIWKDYSAGTNGVTNLLIAFNSNNSALGIYSGHAYSVKNLVLNSDNNINYIEVVNPWDDADVLKLDGNTLNSYIKNCYTFGSSKYNKDIIVRNTLNSANKVQNYVTDINNAAVSESEWFYYYNLHKMLQKNGMIVINEENSKNSTWLSNVINSGYAYLKQLDITTEIFVDTNIAVNTSLREIQDTTLLKKAEAKYEADMKKIDLKDRRYDTDLAALDTERNAIKQEIETLKTVAKDNVERTFKLFS